jgi:hypothetical protein
MTEWQIFSWYVVRIVVVFLVLTALDEVIQYWLNRGER